MKTKLFRSSLLQSVIAGLFFASFSFYSCSSDDDVSPNLLVENKPTSYKLTPQEALDNAKPFLASLETQKGGVKKTMARGLGYKTLKNAKVVFSENTTSAVPAKEGDTLLYVLNLNEGGYIVAATDRRVTPVLAYVEKGEYDPNDTTNTGFNLFLNKTKRMVEREKEIVERGFRDNPNVENKDTSNMYTLQLFIPEPKKPEAPTGWTLVAEVPKRLTTDWGQGFPFNKYIWNGHAGCVAIATIQTMMYKRLPEYIANFEGIDKIPLEWDKIASLGFFMNNYAMDESVREQLALLTSYVNFRLKANIGKKATGANTKDAVALLNSLGIPADKLRRMNELDVTTCLNKGGVLLARGNAHSIKFLGITLGYTDGHAWVVDGYKKMRNGNQEKLYVHCNWGWSGQGNGMYLWNCFYGDSPETTLDYPSVSADAVHFKYNFEYSHVK